MINRIKEERCKLGLSEAQLAQAVSCNTHTIRAIEIRNYIPNGLLLLRIARFFKLPPDELFMLDGEELEFKDVQEEKPRSGTFMGIKLPWLKNSPA